MSALKLFWWPIYVINSVDNTKLPCYIQPSINQETADKGQINDQQKTFYRELTSDKGSNDSEQTASKWPQKTTLLPSVS